MSKFKYFIAVIIFSIGIQFTLQAQVKIGYTNIELVLAYMPEAKAVEQSLSTFQKKLAEKIQVKQNYAQTKFAEYSEKMEKGTMSAIDQSAAEDELRKLDQEIQKTSSDSELELLQKREELLQPILEKLQKAIDDTATENGYTYVLNQSSGGGVSTILFGPEQDDLTEKIMKKLNINIPGN